MKMYSSCLFYDNEDHTWRFYINDNMELVYSIMYNEDKWTKENKIDIGVLDFVVNLDEENKVYIIYSVRGGILKYCIRDQSKWFGKTIYSFDNEAYEISELSVIRINNLMHIFLIGKNNIKKSECSLMHLHLNREKNIINTIAIIPFLKEIFGHYHVHYLSNGDIYLMFIRREENEMAINFMEYKNNKWTATKRLYGITGTDINFYTLVQSNKINVMNLSKEGPLHLLEHVIIDSDGKMKNYKIHESSNDPRNFLLAEIDEVLFAIWTEGNEVFASSYKTQWSEPFKYFTELTSKILMYKYLSSSNKYNNIKCNYILGTNYPEIQLLLPKDKTNGYNGDELEINKGGIPAILDSDAEKSKANIQKELLVLQKINKNLEKRLIDLQMKYQQKQRISRESDDIFIKLTNSKKNAEEKLNIITEIHEKSIKELQTMKREKISKENVIIQLNNQLEQLIDENQKLKQDLKYERNIGIMDRILKKKPEK